MPQIVLGIMALFILIALAALCIKDIGQDLYWKLRSQRGALSADKKMEYKEGVEIPYKVAASTKIYAGATVCVNAAGYLVPGADTAGLIFQGMSREYVDNSLGLDGAQTAIVKRRGLIKMTLATAITIANVGDNVFLVDDDTVDVTANVTNKIFCGIISEYIDTTHAWVDIEPAIKQADVATHIADSSAAHSASAVSIADVGTHFAAAEADVEAALQKLAKTVVITLPRFTGWTKNGSDQTIALPALKMPVAVIIKRAYVTLGTAPGSSKTLALKLNDSALVSIAETATTGEAESLSIAIAASTDFVIKASETSSGAGANADIILVGYVDDGE